MVGVDVEQVLAWDPEVVLLGNFDAAMPDDIYAPGLAERLRRALPAGLQGSARAATAGIRRARNCLLCGIGSPTSRSPEPESAAPHQSHRTTRLPLTTTSLGTELDKILLGPAG